MKRTFTVLAILALLPASAAVAGEACEVPPAERQSVKALAQLANDFEWTIDKLRIDDGCYELRVTDASGNILKVKIDPATLDVVDGRVKRFANDDNAHPNEKKSAPARN